MALDGEAGLGLVDVRREHLDLPAAALGHGALHLLRRSLEACQQRGHELDVVVGLEERSPVGHQGVADAVSFVECVTGEGLDELPHLGRQRPVEPLPFGALDKSRLLLLHQRGDLLPHRFAHDVGLSQRVSGELLENQQHLVLIDDHAVGLFQHVLQDRMRVAHGSTTMLGVDERRDLLDGPWPVERDHGREVAQGGGLELLDVAPHSRALQLKDTGGLPSHQHLERLGVVQGHFVQVDLFSPGLGNELAGLLEDGQVDQPQEVHFQQAQLGDGAHRELGHGDGAVGPLGASVQRHRVHQRLVGDHDAGGMGAGVTGDAFQTLAGVDQPLDFGVAVVRLAKLGQLLLRQLDGPGLDLALFAFEVTGGDLAGDAVDEPIGHAQSPAGVAQRGLGAQGPEGDDLGHPVRAVALDDVIDDLVPAVVLEVHVDVRHLLALDVEEALEDETISQRIDVGYSKGIEHQAGCGAAPDAVQDLLLAGELADLPDDEEVVREVSLADHVQLVLELPANLVGDVGETSFDPLPAQAGQVLVGRRSVGDREFGQMEPGEVQGHVAEIGDFAGVGYGFREVGEESSHLFAAAEVVGWVVHPHAAGLVDGAVRLDAQQHVLGFVVLLVNVVDVVGGDQRDVHLAAHLDEAAVDLQQLRDVVVMLDFQVEVPDDVLEPPGHLPGIVHSPLLEELGDGAVEAAGESDEAFAVALQEFAIEPRPVIEAF